jgi:transposase InsO family protein
MPWKERPVKDQRLTLASCVVDLKHSLAATAREMGVSRKTAYKWVKRYRADQMASMADRSRRPHCSPKRSCDSIEQQVLGWRDAHRWGPRKIHRVMMDAAKQAADPAAEPATTAEPVPSIRTIGRILTRHQRIAPVLKPPKDESPVRFERPGPNQLWQIDHKGPIEIARKRYSPLVILDDHSRYCLKLAPVIDKTMAVAWSVLWDLLGEVGLPDAILCDNAFSGHLGLSWFDMHLVKLGIKPLHGRPYHPQTQGKVERFNGTLQRELIDYHARCDCLENFSDDSERWRRTYNTLRPHESLGDEPPVSRWTQSTRRRPSELPAAEYPSGSVLRKVSQVGDIYFKNRRIMVGRCMERDFVRIEDRGHEIAIFYCWKQIRTISPDQLGPKRCQKRI